ncbi:MAG: cysteine synthase A [Desulfuromonas sp.]|nr:cysteine synthase A [Desulfuromonas sp.]
MPPILPHSILDQIGNTPLLRLSSMETAGCGQIWAKLESANPGGSVKDRIALGMIEQAERDGLIAPGVQLVEPTSGNTGIGLALVCAVKGYSLTLTMPDSMSLERRRLLQAYGAKLVLTPGAEGMNGAIERAEQLSADNGFFMIHQFANPANPASHERTTGPEIYQALDGNVDAFVTGVGTGGTITGVGRYLRRQLSDIEIIAVEPAASAVLSGHSPGPHAIQGIGAGFVPQVLDTDIYQRVITVSNEDAIASTQQLAQHGILAGISSGANLFAARQIATQLSPVQRIVTTICDSGERYMSTGIFDPQ